MRKKTRRLGRQDRENLLGNTALGALAVATRAPHLMPAYLTYVCSASEVRRACQMNPVSAREKEELHTLLFSDERTAPNSRDGMEDLGEEALRRLTEKQQARGGQE